MKFGSRIARALAAALCLSAGTVGADDSSFASLGNIASADGGTIYTHVCQGCHMPQGEGAVGAGHYPAFAKNPRLASWQYVAMLVLSGRNGMPPFGLPADQVSEIRTVHLSDAQVADVVNYVRSHFGNAYADRATADQVAALPHPDQALPR
ncbi:MAG: c-type cytochrome [Solimonas sp.]